MVAPNSGLETPWGPGRLPGRLGGGRPGRVAGLRGSAYSGRMVSDGAPATPASPGVAHAFLTAARDVTRLPAWWRQQAWIATTELLMGFLAAWGMVRGIMPAWVALGLGLAYAVNSGGIWAFRRRGRRAGVAIVLAAAAVLAITGGIGGVPRWLGLCATVGVLLAFRDHQSVHSMAWLPLRARRRGASNMMNLTASAVCGALLLAAVLVSAGALSEHWKWVPHATVCVAFLALVPAQVARMPPGARPLPAAVASLPGHDRELRWLLQLGGLFNAVNFLGRRLVLPAAILAVASAYGDAREALFWLGLALGLMGVVGSLARLPLVLSSVATGRTLMRWGARASLAGWITLAWGIGVWTWLQTSWALAPMLFGWGLLELTNRTWAIAYMEALRESAVGTRLSDSRAHRRALHRFMVRKSAGGALGCATGGLVAVAWLPAVVAVLALGCWALLERGPAAPSEIPPGP